MFSDPPPPTPLPSRLQGAVLEEGWGPTDGTSFKFRSLQYMNTRVKVRRVVGAGQQEGERQGGWAGAGEAGPGGVLARLWAP
jgi:hypothetical protein